MTNLVAIDPGPEKSAWVLFDEAPVMAGIDDNEKLVREIEFLDTTHLAVEMVASYGMPVGREVFETAFWAGRFVEAWFGTWEKVYRSDVKMFLCGNMRAKDSHIRQALIDLYPRTGGGKCPQIGTKAKPGPLYGFKKDMWAALAVAHTVAGRHVP
jgi:hypothetical protein